VSEAAPGALQHASQRFFRACPAHLAELDLDLRCPVGDHTPTFGLPPNERRAWCVIDREALKRVAVVIGGLVRWEEWFEALPPPPAGRDANGFAAPPPVQRKSRPRTIACAICHVEVPVRQFGRVPNTCDECRSRGLRAYMARPA